MATTHYSFPTINGTDTIDGVNAINGLANAVDTALYQVAQEGGSTPGANSINTSMIQNGAVTTEKLNSTVQSQIQQGVNAQTTAQQALAAVNAAPEVTTAPNYSAQGNMTSGTMYSNYVVNTAAHLVSVKVAGGGGCTFKLPTSNTSTANMLAVLFTLPTTYRPSSDYNQLIHVRTGTDGQPILFFLSVASNGKVGLTHINYSSTHNSVEINGEGTICFMYGAQAD